jgi:hypothetical protein
VLLDPCQYRIDRALQFLDPVQIERRRTIHLEPPLSILTESPAYEGAEVAEHRDASRAAPGETPERAITD